MVIAERARYSASPNPGVGCVLVKDGHIVAEGWTQPPGGAHAEIVALDKCDDAKGTTAYVTLEPCAHTGRTGPCSEALVKAGVCKVVAALEDPFPQVSGSGFARLRAAGVDVQTGLLEDQARKVHAGFLCRQRTGRPYVRLKIAASLDGATALANGQSKWITCDAARADVHEQRAISDVVVTGVGTVVADNPMLTARLESDLTLTQPRTAVLDSDFRSPPESHVFKRHSLVYTLASTEVPEGVVFEHATLPASTDRQGLDLKVLLDDLGRRGINNVLVEAGATLSGAFVRQNLVNELVLYQAPRLMGSAARGMLDLGTLTSMAEVIDLNLVSSTQIGSCTKMIFNLEPHG